MSDDDSSQPTWTDLMSAIGSISVGWSFLECEMRGEMRAAGMEQVIAKGSIISHWRTYIRELAAKSDPSLIADYLDPVESLAVSRNLVVHGIQSCSVDPWGEHGVGIVCAGSDGTMHKLTIEMLDDLAREMSEIKMSIQGWRVSAFRSRPKRDRS